MKKLITLSLITTMALSTVAFADTLDTTNTTTNAVTTSTDAVYPVQPKLIVDRNTGEELVPAREYAEGIGYDVKWDGSNKSITFTKGENTFVAKVGSDMYYCDLYAYDPETVQLSSPTTIIDETAYIPRSFAKKLFDIPVVEPMPIIPITPELPVVETVTPEIPVIETITPEVPVINNTIGTIENELEPKLDVEVAKTIANVIDTKMYELEQEQIKATEEYKEAYLATGGTLEDYREPKCYIGYEILSCNDLYTSVKVYRHQDLASSFTEEIYYVFDSTTGEQKSLEYFLGEDYASLVKESILKTANQRMTENPEEFNYDQEALENLVIDENTSFYLDEGNNIIVVLDKYEIAAGVYGPQEFMIKVIYKFD